MTNLYPLKFEPILKEKIWGGKRLKQYLYKGSSELLKIGESWELSTLPDNISIISNGKLKGKKITEIIAKYPTQLLGNKVYNKYGLQFPLLIKFIDANDWLSIQVHPDDELAKIRHNCFGKTEMWYIMEAEKNARLIVGFNQEMTKENYLDRLRKGDLNDVLNFENVLAGDVFDIPAGRIHATGPGILFAEIQQASDITYRIYDWDRTDENGTSRELHTQLASDAIDFTPVTKFKSQPDSELKSCNQLIHNSFYKSNLLLVESKLSRDYSAIDSFVVFIAIEGSTNLNYADKNFNLEKGETILIPACLKEIKLLAVKGVSRLLEVHL